jgi:allophanate hydrolase subunit 2
LTVLALEIANLLVGNPGSTAALEITLGQCVIEFSRKPGLP